MNLDKYGEYLFAVFITVLTIPVMIGALIGAKYLLLELLK